MRRACTLAVPVRRRSSQHGWAAQRDPLGASDRPGSARCDSGACPDSSEGPVLTGRSSAAISGRGVTLGSSRSDLAEQQVSGAGGLGGAELRRPAFSCVSRPRHLLRSETGSLSGAASSPPPRPPNRAGDPTQLCLGAPARRGPAVRTAVSPRRLGSVEKHSRP